MRRRKNVRKDEGIRIRVTADQKALFQLAAERDGITLSAWLVMNSLRAAQPRS